MGGEGEEVNLSRQQAHEYESPRALGGRREGGGKDGGG